MSALHDIAGKFIAAIEELMPELEKRIAIFGQEFKDPGDGLPYVILSLDDGELGSFTGGTENDTWARALSVTLHVYGRNLDVLQVAEELAFCPDKVLFQQVFSDSQLGVFCDRKVRNLSGIEGATPEFRYDVKFTLRFIGSGRPTWAAFESGANIEGITVEQ